MEKVVTFRDDFGQKVKEYSRKFPNRWDEEKGLKFVVQGGSVKIFTQVPIPDELTQQELGRIHILSRHTWKDSNMIGYRGHGGVRPYDIKGISRILGRPEIDNGIRVMKPLAERQTKKFLKKLMDLNIIAQAKVETGGHKEIQYYFNPLYVFNGDRINHTLYALFNRTLKYYISEYDQRKFESNQDVFKEVYKSYGDHKKSKVTAKRQKRSQS